VVPRACISYHDIGGLMAKLRAKGSMAAKALELQILTATRPGEVCSAQWGELQLDNATITVVGTDKKTKLIPVPGLWTIPKERMKAGKEHTIPLPQQAVDLLKALPRLEGTDYVFPGLRPSKPMSTAAGMKLLKGTKNKDGSVKVKGIHPGVTAHGMRSTFRDWAGEATAYPREVIEMAMAHQLKDAAEKAYARGNLIAKRRQLMRDWAKYCDVVQTQQASNVTDIGAARA
jgi:integrase